MGTPVVPLAAVLAVPQQGMAGGGELGPDLVGAAGDQAAGHQGPVSYTHLDVYKRQG